MRIPATVALVVALTLTAAACNRDQATDEPSDAARPPAPAQTAPAAGDADDMPRRKAGLWEMTMSIEGEDMAPVVTRVCLDDATESRMSLWGGQMTDEMCQKNEVTRGPDGSVRFSSVCNMGSGGVTRTTGTATGDLTTNYVVRIQSTTSGAQLPQMNRDTRSTIASRRVGPCEPGQKGGDMMLPGGVTVNMNDMPGPAGR